MARQKKVKEDDDEVAYIDILSIKYEFLKEHEQNKTNVQERVIKQKCDGKCKKKCENVKLVRLYDITIHKDHGYFAFCDDAIRQAMKNGFTVFNEEVNPRVKMTNINIIKLNKED